MPVPERQGLDLSFQLCVLHGSGLGLVEHVVAPTLDVSPSQVPSLQAAGMPHAQTERGCSILEGTRHVQLPELVPPPANHFAHEDDCAAVPSSTRNLLAHPAYVPIRGTLQFGREVALALVVQPPAVDVAQRVRVLQHTVMPKPTCYLVRVESNLL